MPEKMDYIIIGIGALAAVLVTSYVPTLVKAASVRTSVSKTMSTSVSLENIPGVDINSLNTARIKGLM